MTENTTDPKQAPDIKPGRKHLVQNIVDPIITNTPQVQSTQIPSRPKKNSSNLATTSTPQTQGAQTVSQPQTNITTKSTQTPTPQKKQSNTAPSQNIVATKNIYTERREESEPEYREVKSEVFNRPLKSQYEKALERSEKMAKKEQREKPYGATEHLYSEKTSPEQEVNKSLEQTIGNAESFDELVSIIDKTEGMQGSQKWFSKYALLGRINLVRAKEVTTDYVPTTLGLRAKVDELVEKEGILIYKPAGYNMQTEKQKENVPETQEVVEESKTNISVEEKSDPTKPDEVTKQAEIEEKIKIIDTKIEDTEAIEKLREEIQEIFVAKISEGIIKLKTLRTPYSQQIKLKTQHEHTQTRIGGLMSRLFRPFSKKPIENNGEYEKTKKDYEDGINDFKNILRDPALNDEALKKALTFGDEGLQIVKEEKDKLLGGLLKQVLVLEKNSLLQSVGEGLSEKDRKNVDSISSLYKKSGKTFLERMKGIIRNNSNQNG